MTKNEMNTYLAAVLTTLLEMPGHWSPCTPVYMALGCDMAAFMQVKHVLQIGKLAECTPETITLTGNGVAKAKKK